MDQYTVKNLNRICWVLQSLRAEHQLVDIDFPRQSVGGHSMVVDVDTKAGYYYLDRLQSKEVHQMVVNGNTFNLKSLLRGVAVNIFRVEIEALTQDSRGDLYKIKIPEELQYVQKRNYYRAKIRGDENIKVKVTRYHEQGEGEPIQAHSEFLDISVGGCKLSVDFDKDTPAFETGEELSLEIDLPDAKTPLHLLVTTCYCDYFARLRAWHIGCSFQNIEAEKKRIILHLVNELQRIDGKTAALFT